MKKLIALFIVAITVITAFGCENVEYVSESPENESSVDFYEKIEGELPEYSIDEELGAAGGQFVIATDRAEIFYPDEETPGSISTAVQDRNDFIANKYGVEINVIQASPKEIAETIKQYAASKTEYCDMISVSAKETVNLYLEGLLYDINTLPNFDIEKSYFDENNAKTLATNKTLYMIADPSALFYDDTYIFFYNRNLIESSGAQNPETIAMQGNWTWDSFNVCVKTAAAAVFNKAVADIDIDTFGFGSYYGEGTFPLVMWSSADKPLIANTYKNNVGLSLNTNEITDIARNLRNSYNSKGKFALNGDNAQLAFEEGRLVFFCNKLGYIANLRDGTAKGSEYGFLPIPKYDEAQTEYSCLVGSDARVLSLPMTVGNATAAKKELTSVMVSAFCAAGGDMIKMAYLNSCIALYLQNNSETVMIQTIIDSAKFDFAAVYGSGINSVRNATTKAVSDYLDIGSGLANSINMALSSFNKYCNENFNQ